MAPLVEPLARSHRCPSNIGGKSTNPPWERRNLVVGSSLRRKRPSPPFSGRFSRGFDSGTPFESFLSLRDDIKRKVQELEARLNKIYGEDHCSSASPNFSTQISFSEGIMNEPIFHQFKMLSVKPYNGSNDLVDNLEGYKALMRVQGLFNDLLCLAFLVTLKKATRI